MSRRNVLDFGRMLLKLKYTDITKNTYIRSWTVTEIMVREVWKYGSWYSCLYKNTRSKLLNCCANIYFNRQCLIKKVTPKYANIKFPNTSPSPQITTTKVKITCIKDEIKFLQKKKEKLNRDPYNIHLKAAKEWGRVWTSSTPRLTTASISK